MADRKPDKEQDQFAASENPADLKRQALGERMKLECGRRHFRQFEEVQFRRVDSLRELVE